LSSFSNSEGIIESKHYPYIVRTKTFKNDILLHEFKIPKGEITLIEYLDSDHKRALIGYITKSPWLLMDLFKKDETEVKNFDPLKVDDTRLKLYEFIDKNIKVEIDDESGLIVLSANLQDPYLAYEVCRYVQKYIIKYVEDVTNKDFEKKLEYLKTVHSDKKKELMYSEKELADFYEKNRNFTSKSIEFQLSNMRTNYELILSETVNLQSEIHAIEMQLQKERQVVEVFDPPFIPLENSEPNRMLIVLLSSSLFIFLKAAILFISKISQEVRNAGK
jgi:hypothetical protein